MAAPYSVWHFIKDVSRPYRWHLIALCTIACFIGADPSIGSYINKVILDGILQIRAGGSAYSTILAVVLYIVINIIAVVLWRIGDWIIMHFKPGLQVLITEKLAGVATGHSHNFYQEQLAGSIVKHITTVAEHVPELLSLLANDIVWRLCTVLAGVFTLWAVYPTVGWIVMIWAVVFIASAFIAARRLHYYSERSADLLANVEGSMVDTVSNMLAVRLFSARTYERTRLVSLLDNWTVAARRRDWCLLKLFIFQGSSWIVCESIGIWLVIQAAINNVLTIGDVVLFFSVSLFLILSIWNITRDFSKVIKLSGEIAQGLSVLLAPPEVADVPDAAPLLVHNGRIVFDHVSFGYEHDQSLLFNDLSLTIEPGQKVGLVGYSGSGKSTLVNLILRLYDLQSGSIFIDGQNIADVMQDTLRAAIAYIPQDPSLFHRTLMENIQYGRPDATQDEVMEAARRAHTTEFIAAFPHGYQTIVGDRGVKMSGGQRQRIAIARAFLKHARILIMDEATSALDSMTERYIQESFQELMKSCTTIVVAHRLATLLTMDRIIVFDKGVIVEDGPHEQLLKHNQLYSRLWRAQSCGFLPVDAAS